MQRRTKPSILALIYERVAGRSRLKSGEEAEAGPVTSHITKSSLSDSAHSPGAERDRSADRCTEPAPPLPLPHPCHSLFRWSTNWENYYYTARGHIVRGVTGAPQHSPHAGDVLKEPAVCFIVTFMRFQDVQGSAAPIPGTVKTNWISRGALWLTTVA